MTTKNLLKYLSSLQRIFHNVVPYSLPKKQILKTKQLNEISKDKEKTVSFSPSKIHQARNLPKISLPPEAVLPRMPTPENRFGYSLRTQV